MNNNISVKKRKTSKLIHDNFVKKRREIAQKYDEAFSNIEFLKIPKSQVSVNHAYHLYPIQMEFDEMSITKAFFFEKMQNKGINLQVHYIPVNTQIFYSKKYGFHKDDYPNALNFYQREISLPMYPQLGAETQRYIINALINNFWKEIEKWVKKLASELAISASFGFFDND